jgi:hypothetical protein
MDPDGDTNLQHTATSDEHVAADSGHIPGNQETAPAWISPPLPRPLPHLIAGKVIDTIFHWESGIWQHEHERPIFDWGLLDPRCLRTSCHLSPPPISRPFADPIGGKAMHLVFYWETGQWEHEWENGIRLLAPPGPLMEPSSYVLPPLPAPPPVPVERHPPHPVHGQIRWTTIFHQTFLCVHEYEDGAYVIIPFLPRPF